MKKEFDIFTIADLCADVILVSRSVEPEFGQKEKFVDDYIVELGGSCSIFASQAAKLGLKTGIIGNVGNDIFGNLIIKKLNDAGVDIRYINRRDDIKTSISTILCKSNDRAILTYNGSIDTVTIDDIPWDILFNCRHLHIGSYYLLKKIQPYMPYIVKQAKEHQLSISLDVNWDPEEKWITGLKEVFPYVDIFFPNEEEAKAITGKTDVIEAMEQLSTLVPIVVVKQGEKGATAQQDKHRFYCPPLEVKAVDAVGAGDSFDAGFIYGYLNGLPLEECLKIANICGSLNTTMHGGIAGQPDIITLKKYYSEEGY